MNRIHSLMSLARYIFLFISLIATSATFAQTQDSPVKEKADNFYFEAMRMRLKGKHPEAYQLLQHTLRLCPEHVGANYEMSTYQHLLGEDSLAMTSLSTAADNDPDNYWVRQALVQLYVSEDSVRQAIAELEELALAYPQNSQLLFMLENLCLRTEDYQKAVHTLDRIEVLEGKSQELSSEKYRIYTLMKDETKALEEIKKLADEYPNDPRYQVMVGDSYLEQGKTDEALRVYEEVREKYPNNVNLLLSLAKYYDSTKQDSLYVDNLFNIVTNDDLPEETRLKLMEGIAGQNLFSQNNDTAKVYGLFEKILLMPQENTSMGELCVRYMISSNMDKSKIKKVLIQMLDINPETDLARNQLLLYAIEENDEDEIFRLCKTAVDYSSSNPLYYYYLCICHLRKGNTRETIDIGRKGLEMEKTPSNYDMRTNFYSILGDCYHKMGDDKQAFECYDSCLIYKPDMPLVLNNYAYYLSLRKQRLEEAAEMAEKAVGIEGDNANYLDTYAWVLFQQKKYTQAKVYIDKMMRIIGQEPSPTDATMIEHAGDVYSQCGMKTEALRFWNQALELGSESKTLMKKIKKGKYFE